MKKGETMFKTVVPVTVDHRKPIPDLANFVAQRAHTIDGVVLATEGPAYTPPEHTNFATQREEDYAHEINQLRNVIQSACIGGLKAMQDAWAHRFPDAGPLQFPVAQPAPEASNAGEWDSSYQLVGEVQTLHELNDSWIQHLPAGTPLYAKTRTNVGSDGLSDEDRAAMRLQLDEWVSSPPFDSACTWMPIESAPKDGTTLLLRSRKGRVADGCWVPVNGDKGYWAWAFVNQEPAEWAPMLSASKPPQG